MSKEYDFEAEFSKVLDILDDIAKDSSTKAKMALIAHYADNELFVRVVHYALDPYKTFKMAQIIESDNSGIRRPAGQVFGPAIFDLLDSFCLVPALSKKEKEDFSRYVCWTGPSTVEVVNKILAKDLGCGAKTALFQKAHPAFHDLPTHHPMKGESDWQGFFKRAKSRSNTCWSYKLDGTRTWAVVDTATKSCLYLSFNGFELPNFHCFDEALLAQAHDLMKMPHIKKLGTRIIFDGEVENINGDFSVHMSEFRRLNNMDPSGFRFRVFDLVLDAMPLRERYDILSKCGLPAWEPFDPMRELYGADWQNIDEQGVLVSFLPHYTTQRNPVALAKEALGIGLEGIMLKTWDHLYQCKRSWDWCKVKVFETEDLPVVGKIEGKNKYKGKLGALIVNRAGVQTEVGSGYTDEQRVQFWECPPKCIEVKYQQALKSGALRFPVFVRVRDDK